MNHFVILSRCIICSVLFVLFAHCQSENKQAFQREAVENALQKADTIPISEVEALARSLPGPAEQDSFFEMYISFLPSSKGLDSLAAVLPIFEKLRGKEILTQSIVAQNRGIIHQLSGRFDSAEYYYSRNISYWENTREYAKYADALNFRATVNAKRGSLDLAMIDRYKALEVLQNALNKPADLRAGEKEDLENAFMHIQTSLARDMGNKKEFQKSVDLLQTPMDYYLKNNDVEMAATCHISVARAYEALGNFPKALEYCKKSMDLTRSSNNDLIWANSLNVYATLIQKEGKWQEALDTLKVAKAIYEKLNNQVQMNGVYISMGRSQAHLNQIKEAEANFRHAYAESEQRTDYLSLRHVCIEMASLQKQKGNFEEALKFQEKAAVVRDSIMNREKERITKDLEVKYETREKEAQIAALQTEKRLSDQRNLLAAVFALSLAGMGTWFMRYRHRREKMKLEKDILSKQKDLLEIQVKERTAELETANNTKDRLFSIIGHDLRKPTVAFYDSSKIINYLLQKKDFAALEKVGEQIETDAQNLSRLTENLLGWALTQKDVMPYRPEIIEVEALTEHTLEIFSRRAENKGVSIQTQIPGNLTAFADGNAYRTIIRNLVDNAVKYTPTGGKITISAAEKGENVLIKITDTGVGMTADQLADVFSLKKDKSTGGTKGEKGTGLGMHLVHELVAMNRGRVSVESVEGTGTVFSVELPCRPTDFLSSVS